MEQDIRFCELEGRRIAYASIGEGPLLVFGAKWVSHLEEEWTTRGRALLREPRAAGPSRGAVRPTRRRALGSHAPGPPSIDLDTRVLQSVIDACGDEPATVFACSCSAVVTASLAARAPERIRKIVFFGSFASREDLPEATRRSIVDFVRVNWPLAAQMLAGLIVPHASGDEIAALSRYQRHSAEADVAAAFLDLELHADARPFLPNVTMPALVLHRRGDRTVPISRDASSRRCSRTLASSRSAATPTSRTSTTSGRFSVRWRDSSTTPRPPRRRTETRPLEPRGRGAPSRCGRASNREIAGSLVLSEHTVHRHVANILRKLTQSSRAAAAASATRAGYI